MLFLGIKIFIHGLKMALVWIYEKDSFALILQLAKIGQKLKNRNIKKSQLLQFQNSVNVHKTNLDVKKPSTSLFV